MAKYRTRYIHMEKRMATPRFFKLGKNFEKNIIKYLYNNIDK